MRILIQDYKKFVEIAHEKKLTARQLGTQIIEEWLLIQKTVQETTKPETEKTRKKTKS